MWYANMPLKDLQELAVKGKIKNRVISWRLLLKVLSGRHDTIIQQSWTMRHQYYQLKEKLEPKSAVGMDTSVFNPLSQHPEVRINQRIRGTFILRTKKPAKIFD
jgi:hypothetical protein